MFHWQGILAIDFSESKTYKEGVFFPKLREEIQKPMVSANAFHWVMPLKQGIPETRDCPRPLVLGNALEARLS